MKSRLLFFALSILINLQIFSQSLPELWGTTVEGGTNNAGTIFKTDGNGTNLVVEHEMKSFTGNQPKATLLQASNGKFYGTTYYGGTNSGVLFEYDKTTNDYKVLVNFDYSTTSGVMPKGNLIQASNGKLYGTAEQGGDYYRGILYEYDILTNTFTKKVDFEEISTGSYPTGYLLLASNDKIYGATSSGGINNMGTIFEYEYLTNTLTTKHNFTGGLEGSNPNGGLMQASNGKLYGTANNGLNYKGVLFEIDLIPFSYTVKKQFSPSGTGYSSGKLIQAQNGHLYGLTNGGGIYENGSIYEYQIANDTITLKYSLNDPTGRSPQGSLEIGANGNLFGLATYGGGYNAGVLFEYNPQSNTYSKKISFYDSYSGSYPNSSLILANDGNFYGMSSQGGANASGTLFQYNPSTSILTKEFDFNGSTNGKMPLGKPMQASNGKLYGLTNAGGINNLGVLYELDPQTQIYTKLIDFDGSDNGSNPLGSLIQTADGMLYGYTYTGGIYGNGTLFEFNPITNTLTKKIDFNNNITGGYPNGTLMQALNGKLYGLTYQGGVNNCGTLFEYDRISNSLTTKVAFNTVTKGANPYGQLVQAVNGKLYGTTTSGGGHNYGVIFEYNISTNTFTKKLDFDGSLSGGNPRSGLLQATNGKLYGLAATYGANNSGVLFEYDPITNSFANKFDFNATISGNLPSSNLIQATNGKLYGTTEVGGTNNKGVLFEYDLTTSTFTKKTDFNGANGYRPAAGLIEVCELPQITNQLAQQTICAGQQVSYSITATGQGLSYQWEVNTGSGFIAITDDALYSGTNTNNLIITNPSTNLNGYVFQCKVSSTCPVTSIYSNNVALVINPTYSFTSNIQACNNYNWEGQTLTSSGTYFANYTTTSGCDSTYTLNLIINPTYEFNESHTMCSGENYVWQGNTYSSQGVYTINYASNNICDSTYILNLIVNPSFSIIENTSICAGESYQWHGNTYTIAGTFFDNYTSTNGCDSTYTLNLTINSKYLFNENASICQGESYIWHGNSYAAGGNYSTNYNSIDGCDSTYNLNLTVNTLDLSLATT
ncbi:MAG: hypothetical protein KBE91_09790, partial [Bacteroidia bacterium]|nr:hypothetical protein [Bacteroidia bacterium]